MDIPKGRYVERGYQSRRGRRATVEYDTFTKCENRRQDDLRSYLNHRNEYNIDDPKWLRSDAMLDSKNGWGHLELLGRSMRICFKGTFQGAASRATILRLKEK